MTIVPIFFFGIPKEKKNGITLFPPCQLGEETVYQNTWQTLFTRTNSIEMFFFTTIPRCYLSCWWPQTWESDVFLLIIIKLSYFFNTVHSFLHSYNSSVHKMTKKKNHVLLQQKVLVLYTGQSDGLFPSRL